MTALIAILGAALAAVLGLWRTSVKHQRQAEADAALNKSRWQNEMARTRRAEELAATRARIAQDATNAREAVGGSVVEAERVHGAKTGAIRADDLEGLARKLNGLGP